MQLESVALSRVSERVRPADFEVLRRVTAGLTAPVAVLSVSALSANVAALRERARGKSVRVASKSVRCREVLRAVLREPGFSGVLAYTLEEALWLAEDVADVVVGYPSCSVRALGELAASEVKSARVTLMVDSVEHLNFLDAVQPAAGRACPFRVCLDLDASWRSRVFGHVGALRSPVRGSRELQCLAAEVLRRDGYRLVGVMAYEAQLAGVADRPPGNPVAGMVLRAVKRLSAAELGERRAQAVQAVRDVAPLEFVNGGGTGSFEFTALEDAVTELAAGSGLYGPHLFDHYNAFSLCPALFFGFDVVRKPCSGVATVLGGGWVASGPAGRDRLPYPVWPAGLRYVSREGAGEVQTPLRGAAARGLRVGDRVWFRHAKAGEPLERAALVYPVSGVGELLPPVPSYRGEGRCFL